MTRLQQTIIRFYLNLERTCLEARGKGFVVADEGVEGPNASVSRIVSDVSFGENLTLFLFSLMPCIIVGRLHHHPVRTNSPRQPLCSSSLWNGDGLRHVALPLLRDQ